MKRDARELYQLFPFVVVQHYCPTWPPVSKDISLETRYCGKVHNICYLSDHMINVVLVDTYTIERAGRLYQPPSTFMSSTMVNMHTNSIHKMWTSTILKPKKCETIQDSSWQTNVYDCHSIKSQMNLLLKKLIQFQNSFSFPLFSMAVACCYIQCLTFKYQ